MADKTLKKKTGTTLSSKRKRRSKRTTGSKAARQGVWRPTVVVSAVIGAVVIGLAVYGGTMLFTRNAGKTGDVPSYAADQLILQAKETSPDCFTKAGCG
jgi:hypothetical protein